MKPASLLVSLTCTALAQTPKQAESVDSRPIPTYADIAYGEHERHRFDLWIPDSAKATAPFPLLLFFHGGGFVGGDKNSFDPRAFLARGIACASANYRFVDGETTLSPAPFEDSVRALQTIRHRASEWNLDSGRIALTGGSAGGVITLWIGLHDDMADPDADDPIARQSTRVTCLMPINTPTNLDPAWIVENIGGPRHVHDSFAKLFGEPVVHPVPETLRTKVARISPWEFVSAGDPPTLLVYGSPLGELPLPETVSTGESIHHPGFGKAISERMTEVGIEVEFLPGFDPRGSTAPIEWVLTQFGMLE